MLIRYEMGNKHSVLLKFGIEGGRMFGGHCQVRQVSWLATACSRRFESFFCSPRCFPCGPLHLDFNHSVMASLFSLLCLRWSQV